MSKLVDKEKLAKLAQALDARMKAAVEAEQKRAAGIEAGLQGAIDAINSEENGLLAQAAAAAQAKDEAQKSLIDAAIKAVDDKAVANAGAIAQEASDRAAGYNELDARVKELEGHGEGADRVKGVLELAKEHAEGKDAELNTQIGATIDTLDGRVQAAEGNIKNNADAIAELEAYVEKIKSEDENLTLDKINNAITEFQEEQEQVDAGQNTNIEKAQKAADDAQDAVDALAAVVGKKAEGDAPAEGMFADIAANKKAVEDEAAARKSADEGLQSQIDAMKAENGIAKDIADAVAAEAALRAEEDGKLQKAIDDEIARAKAEEVRIAGLVEAEATTARAAEKANKDAIDVLNGEDSVAGSVKKQIKDAVAGVNGTIEALDDRVEANETKLAGLEEGCNTVQAAIDKAEQDAKDYADQQITALVDSAPDAMNTLNELAKAINDNKDVYDAYIEEHAQAMAQQKTDLQAEIDADVKVVADALADEKDATKENSLAKKIADEAAARLAKDNDLEGRVAANEAFIDAQPGIDEAQNNRLADLEAMMGLGGEEGEKTALEEIREDVQAAQGAADAAQADVDAIEGRLDNEGGLVDRIEANEAFVAAQPAVDQAQNERLEALEKANEEGGDVAKAIKAAQDAADAAQAAADQAQDEVDAVELRVDALEGKVGHDVDGEQPATGLFLEVDEAKAAAQQAQNEVDAVEGRVDALEAFEEVHDHSVMEQGIADNLAAINVLNGNAETDGSVAKSIADALEAYSTTEEVKAILGNVVASLALTMENDKVVLKLGGVEGIALSEVDLDLATNEDIDAIIAGLDQEPEQQA